MLNCQNQMKISMKPAFCKMSPYKFPNRTLRITVQNLDKFIFEI